MKEILVITGWYLPMLSANGACVDSVLKEYYKKGYYAHVVSFAKEKIEYSCDYCKVYPITINKKPLSSNFFNKINQAIEQIKNYPLLNKQLVSAVFNQCVEILNEHKIEMVLCVQWPASSGYVGCELKKVFPDKKYVLYALDSLTDNIHNYQSWTKYFAYRNKKLETCILEQFDLMMYLACHKEYYEKPEFKRYANKLVAVDVPLIEKEVYNKSKSLNNNSGVKNLVYSGILLRESRNPDYLLKLFTAAMNKGLNACLHFYSRGDCEGELEVRSKSDLKAKLFTHGYVSKDSLDTILGESDALISIGNPSNEKVFSMPSKFLYYMSLGKPIIHIAPDKYDMCIPYLNRYPQALVVYEDGDFEKSVVEFVSFVQKLDGTLVDFDFVSSEFKENTPAFTAKIMEL